MIGWSSLYTNNHRTTYFHKVQMSRYHRASKEQLLELMKIHSQVIVKDRENGKAFKAFILDNDTFLQNMARTSTEINTSHWQAESVIYK